MASTPRVATTKTDRQPLTLAMRLATGRPNRMPVSRPLTTVPTWRPRLAGSAMCAAIGTTICAVTEVMPITMQAKRKTSGVRAKEVSSSVTAARPRVITISLRFSTKSPSGTSSRSPMA